MAVEQAATWVLGSHAESVLRHDPEDDTGRRLAPTASSRHLLPGSLLRPGTELADSWIPGMLEACLRHGPRIQPSAATQYPLIG